MHPTTSAALRASAALLAVLSLAGCAAQGTTAQRAPSIVAPTAVSSTEEDVAAWLDGLVPAALEREGIVGATVSVVLDGEIVAERGYGYADVGDDATAPRAVDASTLFRIGSISKVVTATAVMQLVEQGSLGLDDPIQEHLDFDLPVSFETPVTVRHLLTHSAGFEDELAGLITSPDGDAVSLRDAVSIDPPEQIFEPGTTPAYSNYSNGLAGYIVERVSGEPFEQYVEENIFDPAGMDTASVAQPLDAGEQQSMSAGYRFAGSEQVPFEVVSPAPAGAVSATSSDMARFMLAQLGAGDEPLLDDAALEQMHAPALDSDDLGGLAAGPRMTLGFFEDARNGHRVLSHAGDLTAFHAQLELYPDDGAGIFVSLNSSGVRDDSSTAVRELLAAGFADRYLPADEAEAPAALPEAAERAATVAGTYQLSRRGESTFIRAFFIASAVAVTDRGQGVISVSALTDASGQPVDLVEVEPWVWREAGGDRVVAADVRDGEVVAVGLNPAFTLQPMPADRAVFPTVALVSALVLVSFLVALPIAALTRRVSRRPQTPSKRAAATAWAAWIAAACAAASVVPWSAVAQALLTDGPAPSDAVIRTGQVLLGLAALGVVPAAWRAVTALRPGAPRRWLAAASWTAVTLGFAGLGFALVVGGVLQPSLSY